jgi:hypothetical protein
MNRPSVTPLSHPQINILLRVLRDWVIIPVTTRVMGDINVQ